MSIDLGMMCRNKESMPTRSLNDDLFAMSGILISCFAICAIIQGTAYLRWRKWSEEEKRLGWRLYGWFTALSCLGSVAGALAYVARIGHLYGIYITRVVDPGNRNLTPNEVIQQRAEINQSSRDMMRCASAYFALFPLELSLVTTANVFVLHRMHCFSTLRSLRKRAWMRCGRIFLAVLITFNVVGFFSNIAAAVYFSQTADLFGDAAREYAANNTDAGALYEQLARDKRQVSGRAASVQRFSEVSLLFLMIVAFCVVGINSYQVIISALRALIDARKRMRTQNGHTATVSEVATKASRDLIDEANSQGVLLKRKVMSTFVFTFVAVLVRSLFTAMFALGSGFNNNSDPCSRSECNSCKNVYSHIHFWLLYTPAFQQTVLLIASPLASLVALWGMSGVRTLEQVSNQLEQLDSMKKLTFQTNGGAL